MLVAGILFALEKSHTTDLVADPTKKTNTPTKQQQKQVQASDSSSKGEFLDNEYSDKVDSSTNNTSDTQPTSTLKTLAIRQGSDVIIAAQIHGITSGICKLTVSNLGMEHSQTADVVYQPEYSSCAGFSVPVSSVGTGVWNILLTASNNASSATSNSTLEVK